MTLWNTFAHLAGFDNVSGAWYGFWSGFGSDLGLFAAVAIYIRSRNCHVKGCKRFRTHQVFGTPYRACQKHHPKMPNGNITADHIERAA